MRKTTAMGRWPANMGEKLKKLARYTKQDWGCHQSSGRYMSFTNQEWRFIIIRIKSAINRVSKALFGDKPIGNIRSPNVWWVSHVKNKKMLTNEMFNQYIYIHTSVSMSPSTLYLYSKSTSTSTSIWSICMYLCLHIYICLHLYLYRCVHLYIYIPYYILYFLYDVYISYIYTHSIHIHAPQLQLH